VENASVPAEHRAVAAVWRIESPRIIARLARLFHDVDLAEEVAQEALLAALEQWPKAGTPDNPGAWLLGAAKHRALDVVRRRKMAARKSDEIARTIEEVDPPSIEERLDDAVGDDLLRLVFVACHPVLSQEAQVALTLRMLGGLTTPEIARAFLVPEPTIAQRIVRAKKTLAEKNVPFEVPHASELETRLTAVLEVLYLIFNEGYAASAGEDWMRPALCEDALRLGRVLAELVPHEPEVLGLVALMELQASRTKARVDANGDPVLLLAQDRARWDRVLIGRGLTALDRGESLVRDGAAIGPYLLQARIAACHARVRTPADTDWTQIAALYAALMAIAPSPIVELNRAVAVGMAFGPAAGLAIVDALAGDPALREYHLFPSVRADLLAKLGRLDEARSELERAAALTNNARERALLLARAATCR
jgi:RNA polymerase sigma-70 factor, ECF subfamily